ncbi:hypothetical protein K490DRAFT_61804 [Saccharata proteae CBS 121410]|uniref:Uncharacterized protein n=1 Tax=Saccharata proteae CBS 121410 TaxID=1314787 RepID=A0A9P4HWI0_9PEZI|nr:hypothetical protein K490DRAFT_61804 [Saccharata proteae CBS 121410]
MSKSSDLSSSGSDDTGQQPDDVHSFQSNTPESIPVGATTPPWQESGSPPGTIGIQIHNQSVQTPTTQSSSAMIQEGNSPSTSPALPPPKVNEEIFPAPTPAATGQSLSTTPANLLFATPSPNVQSDTPIRSSQVLLSGKGAATSQQTLPPPLWRYKQSTRFQASQQLASPATARTDEQSMFTISEADYSGPRYPAPVAGGLSPSISTPFMIKGLQESWRTPGGNGWTMQTMNDSSIHQLIARSTEHDPHDRQNPHDQQDEQDEDLEASARTLAAAKRKLTQHKTANMEQESENIQTRANVAEAKLRRKARLDKELEEVNLEIEKEIAKGERLKDEGEKLKRELRSLRRLEAE